MVALIEQVRTHWREQSPGLDVNGLTLRPGVFAECRVKEANGVTPAEIVAVATTPAVDLVDEVVDPDGLDPMYFRRYPAMFYNHDYESLPVGTMRSIKREGSGWLIRFSVSAHAFAQDVLTLIREGAVNGVSIGMITKDCGPPSREEMDRYGPARSIVRRAMWIETSPTPQPTNPDAMILSKAERIEPSEAFLSELDRLLRLGRVHKSSALKMGLAKPRRKVVLLG